MAADSVTDSASRFIRAAAIADILGTAEAGALGFAANTGALGASTGDLLDATCSTAVCGIGLWTTGGGCSDTGGRTR